MEQDKLEQKIEEIDATIPEKRNPISFQKLTETLNKWLLIKDENIIKVVAGVVIANRLPTDPVWLFIVAPSGGTKTEFIRGLDKIEGIYPISDLTPQTFLSGERGKKDASLLFRLPDNPILTYKDFTTVLTMHFDKKHAILSQLREIYDGSYRKEFGTGESKFWKGKLGFIAGVTPVIDNHGGVYAVLGERFIQYRPIQPDVIQLSRRAMENSGGENQMREEIQNAFADYVAGVKIPSEKIQQPEELKDRIAHLAAFCVKARSGVIREGYSTREIELIPDAEVPTRFAKQIITMADTFYLMNEMKLEETDYTLLTKMGLDSIPQKRRLILEVLMNTEDYLETSYVATKIDYPTNTTRRTLEDLHGLGLLARLHEGQGHADKWMINERTREFLSKANIKVATVRKPVNEQENESVPEKSDESLEGLF